MKKKLIILFILVLLIIGCTRNNMNLIYIERAPMETRAVFISHIELYSYIKNNDTKTSKANIRKMVENVYDLDFNRIILQVRSFSDAIYESSIFPWSFIVSEREGVHPGFDVLEYFINEAHKRDIELHAWINPYRIRHAGTKEPISEENPAYEWLGTNHVKTIDRGTFFNFASEEVKDLIIRGVKEIIEYYNVDGIHFDDYFFPGGYLDNKSFEEYKKTNPGITIEEFRFNMINSLIRRVYKTVKEHDENLVFGISPEANMERNENVNFADVRTWASVYGYVDYLMPQIYFGMKNEAKPFLETLKYWEEMITLDNVKLLPALAFYKVGTYDVWARSGRYEWKNYDNIIMRQILLGRNVRNYAGFALFRYDHIFSEHLATSTTFSELENMRKILN